MQHEIIWTCSVCGCGFNEGIDENGGGRMTRIMDESSVSNSIVVFHMHVLKRDISYECVYLRMYMRVFISSGCCVLIK